MNSTAPRDRNRANSVLPPGLIFEIARTAGIEVPLDRSKAPIRCPFHEDQHPSAVLFATNTFYCSSCGLRLIARDFAEKLGVPWPFRSNSTTPAAPAPAPAKRPTPDVPPFTPSDASRAWNLALARVRLDPPDPRDAPAYAYLAKRGLAAAFDEGVYGILGEGMELLPSIAWWPGNGYRIVSPLFDVAGEIANIQSRAIIPVEKKTRFPAGSRATGTVFANAAAQQLLRHRLATDSRVIVVEGLTDFLAMCVVTSIPVMGAPGAGMFLPAMSDWVRDRLILLAPDHDSAGDGIIGKTACAAYERGAREVRRFRWPQGCKDAADALVKVGPEDVFRAIEDSIGGLVS